jgi:DNA replication protein DnaC
MNINQTFEKLQEIRLHGFVQAYRQLYETGKASQFNVDELIAHLVDAEYDDRYNRKLARLLKAAGLKQQASFEQIDFTAARGIDKTLLLRLQTCDWIRKNRDLLITGSTGVGKSFIACALGHLACTLQIRVMYTTTNKLMDKLRYAKADGSYRKEITKIQKQELLILDDFGLKTLDEQARTFLLEIIDDRHGIRSTIITSQLPVNQWYDIIAEPTIADAIMDRIVHGSHRLKLEGESMRKMRTED